VHTDRLGTPLAATSSPATGNAATIWRASYEPFGLATVNEDADGDSQLYAMHPRFPGQRWDAESGGHQNYFRDYEPDSGRYSEADPIGLTSGPNIFIYALSNPAGFLDPTGLDWVYSQGSGTLSWRSNTTGQQAAIAGTGGAFPAGYSGSGVGVNNPALASLPFVGPIPTGTYSIGGPINSPSAGPFSLPLTPLQGMAAPWRDLFLIHGDNSRGNQTASEGCPILPLDVRKLIHASKDRVLQVVP
jgi:RHS repeat-associated protein